jgi:lysyl-tRNA synthetase class II
MKTKPVILAAALMLSSAIAVFAHHSFAATYDQKQTITITGRMVQFSFRNPHSFVQVEVDDGKDKVRWAVEWAGAAQLANSGIQNDTLKYGDTVVITGNPGRNPEEHRIRMTTVKRPDGFTWGDKPGQVVE